MDSARREYPIHSILLSVKTLKDCMVKACTVGVAEHRENVKHRISLKFSKMVNYTGQVWFPSPLILYPALRLGSTSFSLSYHILSVVLSYSIEIPWFIAVVNVIISNFETVSWIRLLLVVHVSVSALEPISRARFLVVVNKCSGSSDGNGSGSGGSDADEAEE
jgi:hypothetical protein